jgi:hypothetical protein
MRDTHQPEQVSSANLQTHACLDMIFTLENAESFCQKLPTHNITETAKQLYDFFTCFNQHKVEATKRHEITSLLMLKIDYVFDSLFKQYFSSITHDLKIQQHILILIENLFTLSKESYKIIIGEQIDKLFPNKDLLAYSFAHCLRMNLKILFIHFLAYSKTPKYLWLECHSLYQLAEKKKILSKTLRAIDKEIGHYTVSDWYKHILLFSIANPYRLCSQELLLLYHALPFWTKYTKVDAKEDIQDELFTLDLSKDNPPVYASLNLFPTSKNTRILILKKLTGHLDSLLISKNNASSTEANLPQNLVKQLIATWSYFSNRGQDRVEVNQPAKIFTGLHGVIQALLPEQNPSLVFDCTIINESPGGFCLEFDAGSFTTKQPQTGDLLGLSTQLDANQYQLTVGAIRWIKQLDSNKIQCGLQLIGHHPLALTIQIVSDTEEALIGDPQQILFIPEMPAFGRGESIVSPGMPFKPGLKFKLLSSHSDAITLPLDRSLTLSDEVLSTGNFKQFFIQLP